MVLESVGDLEDHLLALLDLEQVLLKVLGGGVIFAVIFRWWLWCWTWTRLGIWSWTWDEIQIPSSFFHELKLLTWLVRTIAR